jgi:hypothetical protein
MTNFELVLNTLPCWSKYELVTDINDKTAERCKYEQLKPSQEDDSENRELFLFVELTLLLIP